MLSSPSRIKPQPSRRPRTCSLLLLLGAAFSLAWTFGYSTPASAFADSPASPLTPTNIPASVEMLSISSWIVSKALLVGLVLFVIVVGVSLLDRAMVDSDADSVTEGKDSDETTQ